MKVRTFKIGGIHPEENKLSHESATQPAPLPKQAIFPMSQHIGAPAKPVVKKGDKVKVIVRFRGREVSHSQIGYTLLERFADQAKEAGSIEKPAKLEGRNMTMFLAPLS